MEKNKSEELLSRLGKKSFLSLWSIPNPYYAKAKELCDLLVIFDNNVLIFSIKEIAWPLGKDISTSWSRWYRKAVLDSKKQVGGAIRKLKTSDTLFTDSSAKNDIGIPIPDLDSCNFHAIVVAFGAGDACKEFTGKARGSLAIDTTVDFDEDGIPISPFVIPRLNSTPFIHVFDDQNLEILMQQLDTISDFTEYLAKKEKFFSISEIVCLGEEELMAMFLRNSHTFPTSATLAVIPEGHYDGLMAVPNYKESIFRNRVSYFWDELIDKFTTQFLDGTGQPITFGQSLPDRDIKRYELAIRQMAFPNRHARRSLAEGALDAIRIFSEVQQNTFTRCILDPCDRSRRFLIVVYRPEEGLDYEEEQKRAASIVAFNCMHHGERDRQIESMSAIGFVESRTGSHEVLMYFIPPEWTEDEVNRLNVVREITGVGKSITESRLESWEFPDPADEVKTREPQQGLNRRMRRKMAAKKRRGK